MFYVSIPNMTDDKLLSLYKRIKPVITFDGELCYFKKDFTIAELRNRNYLCNIKSSELKKVKPKENLKEIEGFEFDCLHCFRDWTSFRATVAEVLEQIDDDIIGEVRAFEIVERPETSSDFYKDDLRRNALKNGYHVSKVKLYK